MSLDRNALCLTGPKSDGGVVRTSLQSNSSSGTLIWLLCAPMSVLELRVHKVFIILSTVVTFVRESYFMQYAESGQTNTEGSVVSSQVEKESCTQYYCKTQLLGGRFK